MFTYETWKGYPSWKKLVVGAGVLLSLAVILSTIRVALFGTNSGGIGMNTLAPDARYFGGDTMTFESSDSVMEQPSLGVPEYMVSKSVIAPLPYDEEVTVGEDAEEYETLSYDALFKKRNHTATCDTVESWKPLAYVVFEQANRGDVWCSYTFKVERAQAENIVKEIQGLEPAEFSANTESIKRQVVEYDSQLNILLQKQDMLETLLADAVSAYDELTALATQVEDVESLTKIIDSKLRAIENLTQQRIMLSQQIDTLARRSAELNDRIEYVSFSVHVQKYKVFDGTAIKDSWVRELQRFVGEINGTLQELSLGVLNLFVQILVVLVYVSIVGFAILVFVKNSWHFVRRFWSTRGRSNLEQ